MNVMTRYTTQAIPNESMPLPCSLLRVPFRSLFHTKTIKFINILHSIKCLSTFHNLGLTWICCLQLPTTYWRLLQIVLPSSLALIILITLIRWIALFLSLSLITLQSVVISTLKRNSTHVFE